MPPAHRLLLSGVPAAGKSCFAKWLEKRHGYRRFNFDERVLPAVSVAAAGNVVVEYGFPPDVGRRL